MENIIEYANQAIYWIGAIVTAATVIVRITPTTRDDSVLEKIIHILDYFSVVNPNGTRTLKIVGKKNDNK